MKKALAVVLAVLLIGTPLLENAMAQDKIDRIEKTMPAGELQNCKDIQHNTPQFQLNQEGWTFNQCILAFE